MASARRRVVEAPLAADPAILTAPPKARSRAELEQEAAELQRQIRIARADARMPRPVVRAPTPAGVYAAAFANPDIADALERRAWGEVVDAVFASLPRELVEHDVPANRVWDASLDYAAREAVIRHDRRDGTWTVTTRAGEELEDATFDLEVEALAFAAEHDEARTFVEVDDLPPTEIPGAASRFIEIGSECIVRARDHHLAVERFFGSSPNSFITKTVEARIGDGLWSRSAGRAARNAVVAALEALTDRHARAAAAEARLEAARARQASRAVPSDEELAAAERALDDEAAFEAAIGVERIDDGDAPTTTTDDDADFDAVVELD